MFQPTLRQLEYAVAVGDHQSFHAAARACGVTQPGLSTQLRQLESLLGLRLFERDRRKVLVTRGGDEILRRAREILSQTGHLVEAARVHGQPLSGTLRLGVIPTLAPYLLPRTLPRVRQRYPEIRLRLHEGQTADLLERLRRGDLELLLLALEAPLQGVETLALFRDPFVAALPNTHRLAHRRRLAESDLASEPVLLLEDGHCLRQQALSFCARAGSDEREDFRASSLPTLVQMVAGGEGLTLLPTLALPVEGKARGLAIVPFRRPAPYRTVGLAWRPTSPRSDDYRLLAEFFSPGSAATQ